MGLMNLNTSENGMTHKVKELVHELGFLHFGDIDDDPFAGAFHPAGFGMGTATTRKHQQTCVSPVQGVQIGLELPF